MGGSAGGVDPAIPAMNVERFFIMRLQRLRVALLGLGLAAATPEYNPAAAQAAQPPLTPAREATSLKNELQRAMDRGADWLAAAQTTNGFWSTKDQPAVTAISLVALRNPLVASRVPAERIRLGYDYLVQCRQEDGSFHGGAGMVNYNTSLAILALAASGNPAHLPLLRAARRHVAGSQVDLGVQGAMDTPFDGGVGYNVKYGHSDMANTLAALEAMRVSRPFAGEPEGGVPGDLNYAAAIQFLQNCQQLKSHNQEAWVTETHGNKGGFVYFPGKSMAEDIPAGEGKVALRSYGSISYAGLLSYIYADLKKEDPRVQAVFQWLRENYTLEENPGMGPQGLFYYYHTMAKALTAFGADAIRTADGRDVLWREKLALKLLDLQKGDGRWENDNGRWWEKDPALVTSYALMTLQLLHSGL